MPRLPIVLTRFLGAAMLAVTASFSLADAAVLVRSAKDLEKAREVIGHAQPYMALSAANVIYERCGTELKVTDEKRAALKELFTEESSAYMQGFRDAYVAKVKAEPTASMSQSFSDQLRAQQQTAVNQTAKAIVQYGCTAPRMTRIMEYVEKKRQANQGSH